MFGNNESHADPNYIPSTGESEGYIDLNSDKFFVSMHYCVFEDSDWLMVASITSDSKISIQWRMRYFADSDDNSWHENGDRYSWHNLIGNDSADRDELIESVERLSETMQQGYCFFVKDSDAKVQVLKLECSGDKVWEKIVDEAPWYPIPDPMRLACKNQLL